MLDIKIAGHTVAITYLSKFAHFTIFTNRKIRSGFVSEGRLFENTAIQAGTTLSVYLERHPFVLLGNIDTLYVHLQTTLCNLKAVRRLA